MNKNKGVFSNSSKIINKIIHTKADIKYRINNTLFFKIVILFYSTNLFIKVASLNYYSEVILTIKGKRKSQIILNGDASQKCYQSSRQINVPDKIYINGILKSNNNKYAYDLDNDINKIIIRWDKTIKNCNNMFSYLQNIENIDFSNFDTSQVTFMACMFQQSSFSSLDLSHFETSKVQDMGHMFNGCTSLVSLNLNNFDTSSIYVFGWMFFGCSSLVSLNLNHFTAPKVNYIEGMFNSMNSNLVYCINVTKASKIKSVLPSKDKLDCNKICNGTIYYYCLDDKCPEDYKFLIPEKKDCIKNCSLDNTYKYDYNNICYKEYSIDILKELFYLVNNSTLFNDTKIDEIIKEMRKIILNINPNYLISEIKNCKDLTRRINDIIIISLTSTENQKCNINMNLSKIDLGDCEKELKKEYNISNNESLLIFKLDILKEDMKIPRIEYEVYYPLFGNKLIPLDLNKCKNIKINIGVQTILNEKEIDKHNISSNYYNDICQKSKSEYDTDITLNDRKEVFLDNDMNACEENCKFEKYEIDRNRALCSCNVKTYFKLFSEVEKNKELLLIGFKSIKNTINLNIIKCYYILFNIEGIAKNIGSYIILSTILFYLISIIIFYTREYFIIKNKISEIVYSITNLNINDNKRIIKLNLQKSNSKTIKKRKRKSKASPPSKKIKIINKINYSINVIQTGSLIQNNKINDNSKSIINLNKKTKKMMVLQYNIYELNNLTYEEAIKNDKRTYIQYYLSLLKTKHILLFYLCPLNDYNSKIIKILLFLFSFIIHLIVNALFFNDSTIHKIYTYRGEINLLFQIAQIVYSSIISFILNFILRELSLTEKNILELKRTKNVKKIDNKFQQLLKYLYIKFILFFIISFIFLLLFWYYLALFCAIYENTQIYLIKDCLISFGISMIYPFALYLIPGIFRIPSLKSNKREMMYKLSKIFQII